jgi:hypothetical protein
MPSVVVAVSLVEAVVAVEVALEALGSERFLVFETNQRLRNP